MRERTMLLLGVLFLIISIGAGVNKSLESGNKMVGRPMSPGIREVCGQVPMAVDRMEEYAGYARNRSEILAARYYPVLSEKAESAKADFTVKIKAGLASWREKMLDLIEMIRERAVHEKNQVV